MSDIKITDFVEFNPKRIVKKGDIAPFVDMAALPVDSRDISEIGRREFKGSGSKFINGDTLFARITPCLENGKTAKVTGLPEGVAANGSTEFIVMSAKEPEYDEDYIYYLARLPEFRAYAQARMEGTSGRQRVPWQSLVEFEFEFPEKTKRKEIGAFFKVLDDKIELNRQTNQTLENIAQAIFKSWFVDFEPTRAKIAAKQNGQDPERAAMAAISGKTITDLNNLPPEQQQSLKSTAALFPNTLTDSELGEIPEGWELGELKNIAEFSTDRISTSELSLESYISTENMLEGKKGVSIASSLPTIRAVPRFNLGQILISNIRPYFMKIWLARFEGGRSNDVLGIEAKEPESVEYLYNLLYQDVFFNFMMTTSKGAKMPRGDKEAIMGWICVQPTVEVKKSYSVVVENFYKIIDCASKENKRLEGIRGALLPKLLSGELEITEMEKVVANG